MTHIKETKFIPRKQYTGGYGKAFQAILKSNYNSNKIILDDLGECKNFTNVVTHPITGNQMEYRKLIKDTEYIDCNEQYQKLIN